MLLPTPSACTACPRPVCCLPAAKLLSRVAYNKTAPYLYLGRTVDFAVCVPIKPCWEDTCLQACVRV